MEDQKVINYSLHTLYKTSLAIAGVTLFSFSLGMVQPSTNAYADAVVQTSNQATKSSSPLTKGNIIINSGLSDSNGVILGNGDKVSLDLGINVQGAGSERIHPGDKFTVKFSPNSVDIDSLTPSWEVNSSGQSFDDLFSITRDANNNSITITAKQNANFDKIQQLKFNLAGHAQTTAEQKTDANVTASFTLNGQSTAIATQTYKFNVKDSSGGSTIAPTPTTTTVAIWGDATGAALHGQHNLDPAESAKFSDNWLDNDPSNNAIDYVHNQDSMLAYAQLALPATNRPKEVTWHIWSKDGKGLNPKNALVFIAPNDGNWPTVVKNADLKADTDPKYPGGLVFTSSQLPPARPSSQGQPTINIAFYVDTDKDDVKTAKTINTAVSTDNGQESSSTKKLVYQQSYPTGYTPFFR
ncbi:MAG: hypothetical protein ABF767_07160, partial [Lentilactobacillus hilgardii]